VYLVPYTHTEFIFGYTEIHSHTCSEVYPFIQNSHTITTLLLTVSVHDLQAYINCRF